MSVRQRGTERERETERQMQWKYCGRDHIAHNTTCNIPLYPLHGIIIASGQERTVHHAIKKKLCPLRRINIYMTFILNAPNKPNTHNEQYRVWYYRLKKHTHAHHNSCLAYKCIITHSPHTHVDQSKVNKYTRDAHRCPQHRHRHRRREPYLTIQQPA